MKPRIARSARKFVIFIIIIALVVTTAAASYMLFGSRLRLPVVDRGVFGVGTVSGPVDLLAAGGSSTAEATFPYVSHPEQLQLGECGVWSDGEVQAGRMASWTISLNDETAGAQQLCCSFRLSGPNVQAAAAKLVLAVEITGGLEGGRTITIYADGSEAMGDGPWYAAETGEMVTPQFFLGTVTEDTAISVGVTAFSMATEEVPGEFAIKLDVCPEENALGHIPVEPIPIEIPISP